MRTLAASFVVLVLALAAPVSGAKLPIMVGNWYGERQPDSTNVIWLAHIQPDGRFSAEFRNCDRNAPGGQVISGTWTYKDGLWDLDTLLVNGVPVNELNQYKTVSYDGRRHVYRHLQTGFVFSAIRVGEDFKLGPCDLTG